MKLSSMPFSLLRRMTFLGVILVWGMSPGLALFGADQPADALKPVNGRTTKKQADAAALAAPLVEAIAVDFFGGAVNVNQQQADAMVEQFAQQYRGILHQELRFIRETCDLEPEQRKTIRLAGDASLKEAGRKMAQQQQQQMRGVGIAAQFDPRKTIRDALAAALKKTLTEKQMAKYQDEAEKRIARRKKAAIVGVVALMDSMMNLNADQREKITKTLSTQWQDKWEQWLMISSYGNQYLPVIPEGAVTEVLNADQKSVWQGIQKVDFGFWVNDDGQGVDNDGWWGVKPNELQDKNARININLGEF